MSVALRRRKPAVPGGGIAPAPMPATAAPLPAPGPASALPPGPPATVAQETARQQRRHKRAQRQVLTEWHRVDVQGLDAPWQDRSRPTSEVMPLVLSRLNLEQRLAESQILQMWDRVMDRTITAHAKPVGLRRGTLFINVDSNAWLSELVRYRYAEMLEKLQLSVGKDKVERLSLRVG